MSPGSPIAIVRLASAAALLLTGLALAPPALAQPAPVLRRGCGDYEAVPSGKAVNGQPTRLTIQKNGRLLLNISDWSITRVECADVDGDWTFELLVTSHSAGAHCCETLHAWALGPKPAKLLEYPAGSADGFELRDLDGDGRLELLVGDDTFAGFGDLCETCSPARVPMILCRTVQGFEDCTRRFPAELKAALAGFTGRLRPPAGAGDVQVVEGAALGALAIWSLLGDEDQGLAAIRAAVDSEDVMKWLERARPQVRDWVRARGKRIRGGK